jgi:hypothetical protein
MPTFYQDVEAEVDIEIDEFISMCSKREMEELITALKEGGYLDKHGRTKNEDIYSYDEEELRKATDKIENSYLALSKEDLQTIVDISKKY